MKIFLRDTSEEMADEWKSAFAGCDDVEASLGNIFDLEADAIVSPANSFGFMDGGIDLAYSRHFGFGLQARLQQAIKESFFGELPVGSAIVVETGHGGIKYLVSAPTMRVPSDVSGTVNSYLAFRAALIEAVTLNRSREGAIRSMLCPGLGTLTGRISHGRCARQMRQAYDSVILKKHAFPVDLEESMQRHDVLAF